MTETKPTTDQEHITKYISRHVRKADVAAFWDVYSWVSQKYPIFKFDGASRFPDGRGKRGMGLVWLVHDIGYFLGGKPIARRKIDRIATDMLSHRGRWFIAALVLFGLMIGPKLFRKTRRRFTHRTDGKSWTTETPKEIKEKFK